MGGQQCAALLPDQRRRHPLVGHRPRIPDRVVFDKLVQVLVHGCAYARIVDERCSATTIRRRRDEWIHHGSMSPLDTTGAPTSARGADLRNWRAAPPGPAC